MRKLSNYEGVEFEHDGGIGIEYVISHTEDGERWVTAFFDSLERARDYATEVMSGNEQNADFMICAERTIVLSVDSFLDYTIPEHHLETATNLWLERQFRH